jgi:hypothetical protein
LRACTEINAGCCNRLSLNDIEGRILVSELLKEGVGLIVGEGCSTSETSQKIMSSGMETGRKPKRKTE